MALASRPATSGAGTELAYVSTDWLVGELRRRHVNVDMKALQTGELVDELRSRGYVVVQPATSITLPGLTLTPSRGRLEWAGREWPIGGRTLEIIRVLTLAWPGGVSFRALARAIWGSADTDDINVARSVVCEARIKLPGLIVSVPDGHRVLLRLALDEGASING